MYLVPEIRYQQIDTRKVGSYNFQLVAAEILTQSRYYCVLSELANATGLLSSFTFNDLH